MPNAKRIFKISPKTDYSSKKIEIIYSRYGTNQFFHNCYTSYAYSSMESVKLHEDIGRWEAEHCIIDSSKGEEATLQALKATGTPGQGSNKLEL